MSRSEVNNPTNRIGQILDDFDALDYAYDQLAQLFAVHAPERFEQLPAKPAAMAVAQEKTRRQLTLGKVTYKRQYMRLQRSTEPEAVVMGELSAEDKRRILDEVAADLVTDTTP